MKIEKSLLSGSTPMLVLSLLKDGDKYGYEMVEALAKRSDDTFLQKEGTLDPLHHTLEKNHYVTSYTKQTPSGRERKNYRHTSQGRGYLDHKESERRVFSEKVNTVLGFSGA